VLVASARYDWSKVRWSEVDDVATNMDIIRSTQGVSAANSGYGAYYKIRMLSMHYI
jgi:hypothetical protein